jgi:hypothetical protein
MSAASGAPIADEGKWRVKCERTRIRRAGHIPWPIALTGFIQRDIYVRKYVKEDIYRSPVPQLCRERILQAKQEMSHSSDLMQRWRFAE